METLFPFGLPSGSASYLVLYVLTLMVHVVFMNYVLAGSAYVTATEMFRGRDAREDPLALVLRDWMPFVLSAAITAGVAPLLFVQILYKKQFYTGNLLLLHRWLAVLPALIIGFYLLYLLKSGLVAAGVSSGSGDGAAGSSETGGPSSSERRGGTLRLRLLAAMGAFLCFGFIAWFWTEIHILSLQEQRVWSEHYASGRMFMRSLEVPARLSLWFFAAFPTMALLAAWQLRYHADRGQEWAPAVSRRPAVLALAGLALAACSAAVYCATMEERSREALTSPFAAPFTLAALVGCSLEAVAWIVLYRRGALTRAWLSVASIGLFLALLGTSVAREAVRLSAVDIAELQEKHEAAARAGGFGAFLFFAVVNAGVIVLCLFLVRQRTRPAG